MCVAVELESGVTAEELFAEWQYMVELRVEAGKFCKSLSDEWRNASTQKDKAMCWARVEDAYSNYMVLSAWTELMYSTYVFLTEGHTSFFLHDSGLSVDQQLRDN